MKTPKYLSGLAIIILSTAFSLSSVSAEMNASPSVRESTGIYVFNEESATELPYTNNIVAASALYPVEESRPLMQSESSQAVDSLTPDWVGLKRDTKYFLGWQFVVIGALYSSPESVSSWSPEAKNEYGLEKWKNNVTNPVLDGDDWYINFALHPYWGATYYTRARERGLDRTESFMTAVAWSALFEFTSEALFEPVSLQDLVVTPVAGALIGEYVFAPIRENIKAKPDGPNTLDKTLLVLTDPFYYLNTWADRVLGVKTDVQLQISSVTPRDLTSAANVAPVTQWNVGLRTTW